MKRASLAGVAILTLLVLASNARATALPFTGALTLQIATLAPVVYPGAGVAVINGSSGVGPPLTKVSLAGGTFYLSHFVLPVTDPSVFPIVGVQVTAANGPGSFAAGPGGFGGHMPLNGVSKVCIFSPCASAYSNLVIPLSNVGVGGSTVVTGAVNLTVVGAPWTTGTAQVGTITAMGGITDPGGAGAGLAIRLVTPIFISTNIGASSVIPAFGYLPLHFVPEPASLGLLGCGIAALAGYCRNRPWS